jgi:hypothetical protein
MRNVGIGRRASLECGAEPTVGRSAETSRRRCPAMNCHWARLIEQQRRSGGGSGGEWLYARSLAPSGH